jgi:glycosyltransferase involved in cell wall biosynthesis
MTVDRHACTSSPSVVYILPDKMGGVATNVAELVRHHRSGSLLQHVVFVHNPLSGDTRFGEEVEGHSQVTVEHSMPLENLHTVIRRVARALPVGPGVLVANDWIELAMLYVHDPGRTVIQVVHGDYEYYYDLAAAHESVIDVFVALTQTSYEHLRGRMPHRRDAIFLLPFGVTVVSQTRGPSRGALRLLFVGRLDRGKGIQDLPLIDECLQEQGLARTWTLVGDGPGAVGLDSWWRGQPHVRLLGRQPHREVLKLYAEHDVLVLPSRAEGLPRAVLEAMSAGVVPIVSDLACGVRDIVEPGVSGYLPRPGDVAGFAAAIEELDRNRARLETIGLAARRTIVERFDVTKRAAEYESLYLRWKELYRARPRRPLPYGSRLDQPWLPNALVYAIRATRRRWTVR